MTAKEIKASLERLEGLNYEMEYLKSLRDTVERGIKIDLVYSIPLVPHYQSNGVTRYVEPEKLEELKKEIMADISREIFSRKTDILKLEIELCITPELNTNSEGDLLAERPPFLKRVMD